LQYYKGLYKKWNIIEHWPFVISGGGSFTDLSWPIWCIESGKEPIGPI
jgi:hypothetical protein